MRDPPVGCYTRCMPNATTRSESERTESRQASDAPRFERPSLEEISICCEISAYAPDGDDRPLF